MRRLITWIGDQDHSNNSMFILNIIAHGTEHGFLMSVNGRGLTIDHIVGSLNDIQTLIGKPKVVFVNACRGGTDNIYTVVYIMYFFQILC